MTACIFLGLLALLFAVNVVINAPLDKPADIGRSKAEEFPGGPRKWYVLRAGDYSVDADLNEIRIRSSFLPFVSQRYTYYSVTVNPGTEDAFRMAVRVTGEKRSDLSQGKPTDLYGMVSAYKSQSSDAQVRFLDVCLNDNGTTALKRGLTASVFALATGVCIWLILKILMKR